MANQLQTGTKKENQKKPAAIDRIEKRKNPAQHTRSMLLHFAMPRQKKSLPLQIDKRVTTHPLPSTKLHRVKQKRCYMKYTPETPE